MHSSLKFTVEKESNHQLDFLDVFVHKTSTAFLTSVYRKPTFSGLYTRWDSFCPQQRKINLIETLVHCALMISSKCFDDEIEFIRSTVSKKGYPVSVLDGVVHDVVNMFDRAKRCTVNKCPIYLRLSYIGSRGCEICQIHHHGSWQALFFCCCASNFSDSHCIRFNA